jgi:hypothetical protein
MPEVQQCKYMCGSSEREAMSVIGSKLMRNLGLAAKIYGLPCVLTPNSVRYAVETLRLVAKKKKGRA